MAKKKYSPEQVVAKRRQIEVLTGGGKSIPQACKEAGITDVTYYRWRREYNEVRPHSSRGYRPPAPAAGSPRALMLAQPEMVQ